MGDDAQGVQPQPPAGNQPEPASQQGAPQQPQQQWQQPHQQYGQPPYGQPPQGYAPQGYASQQQTQPPAHRSKGSILLGLLALIAGIVSLILNLVPGEMVVRVIVSSLAIVAAAVGVTLAIISLSKKWRVGLSIAGLIVSGFALLFSIGFLALGLIANYQVDAMVQKNNDETQARIDEEQAEQDEILDRSQWVDDARDEMEESDFTEVDEATLDAIMADPEAHMEEGIIVNASMGEPLTHEGFNAQGICMVGATLTADGAEQDLSERVAILDRGTADDCPLIDRMLGLGEDGDLSENLADDYRMWLVPSGTIPNESGEEMPAFLLMNIED